MTKVLGFGTLVKVDHDDNSSFTTVGMTREATPPPSVLKEVDGTELGDSREKKCPGQFEATEFTFTQFWKPGDDGMETINTLQSNANSYTTPWDVDWQVVYNMATPVTQSFSGWVKDISPDVIKVGEFLTRQVTVVTTSESTYA